MPRVDPMWTRCLVEPWLAGVAWLWGCVVRLR